MTRLDNAIATVGCIQECLQCYVRIAQEGNCNTCKNIECTWQPKWGKQIRYNCPHFVGIDAKEK